MSIIKSFQKLKYHFNEIVQNIKGVFSSQWERENRSKHYFGILGYHHRKLKSIYLMWLEKCKNENKYYNHRYNVEWNGINGIGLPRDIHGLYINIEDQFASNKQEILTSLVFRDKDPNYFPIDVENYKIFYTYLLEQAEKFSPQKKKGRGRGRETVKKDSWSIFKKEILKILEDKGEYRLPMLDAADKYFEDPTSDWAMDHNPLAPFPKLEKKNIRNWEM